MTAQGTVYLVDDDHSVRKSASRLFRNAGFNVMVFESADEFLEFEPSAEPACLILDINMPGLSGTELQNRLSSRQSILPIVFMTGHGDIPTSVKTIKAGAVDFLPKPVDQDLLIGAAQRAIELHAQRQQNFSEIDGFLELVNKLTRRERQVLELVVEGLLNKQIARRLEISEATVKVHRGRVMEKLSVESLAELVRKCERVGL